MFQKWRLRRRWKRSKLKVPARLIVRDSVRHRIKNGGFEFNREEDVGLDIDLVFVEDEALRVDEMLP